jgi:hypothetical protein
VEVDGSRPSQVASHELERLKQWIRGGMPFSR